MKLVDADWKFISPERLFEAGDRLVEARRAWAETFLRYKMGRPQKGQNIVTDNQAKAMADIDVNVTRAEVDYYLAQQGYDHAAQPRK